ncbi:hypothetical protein [Lentzea sp.]|uniref:hypothetical protein n=1 Tax=Lentzea sp. TaxID=56099 RepID=UPI002CD616D4|nr:hypothetical protein [Lentzea sp.]HUQ57765.1 hypothetical protein [Lentzea sp.]
MRLLPRETTPDRLRQAIATVLAESRYREAAAEVAGDIAGMPAAAVAESIAMIVS